MQKITNTGTLILDIAKRELARRTLSIDDFIAALQLGYQIEPWQRSFIHITVDPRNTEILHIRSRGGSKTFDNELVLLYFAFLGFHCRHFVARGPQILQPQRYLKFFTRNTFLYYAIAKPIPMNLLKRSVSFENGGYFDIVNLTEGTGRSMRLDVIYLDEEREMEEEVYVAAQGCLSMSKLGKTIHGSTPAKGTIFEENFNRMEKLKLPILIRKYGDIGFINHRYIEEVVKPSIPLWFFNQEYNCEFTASSGAVFNNIIEGDFSDRLAEQSKLYDRHWVHGGVDWNPIAGHWIVGTQWSDDYHSLYVIFEKNMGSNINIGITIIIDLLAANPHMRIELEDGGTNAGYCDAMFRELYLLKKDAKISNDVVKRVYRVPWDSAGKNKSNAITMLMPSTIYYNNKVTPQVGYWLERAHWDPDSTEPKLEKDPDQHPLDGMLHSSRIRW